ncbi:hypothetical protein [Candidatus Ichthyocystis sparus]|nr:hypothetical protein [Candidatus Ichthyocystis sparus]
MTDVSKHRPAAEALAPDCDKVRVKKYYLYEFFIVIVMSNK